MDYSIDSHDSETRYINKQRRKIVNGSRNVMLEKNGENKINSKKDKQRNVRLVEKKIILLNRIITR